MDGAPLDAGVPLDAEPPRDGGATTDSGRSDTGLIEADAGRPDASADAGRTDDAGSTDAGSLEYVGTTSCPTADLGGAVGEAVATGSLNGSGNRFVPSCRTQSSGEDHHFSWTAPESAEWTFDTLGSSIDTLLAVVEGTDCSAGTELGCNDDADEAVQSALRLTLSAGQTVRVVVDEYGVLESGAYRLSIHRDVPTAESDCGDGFDEDRDGARDCLDPDCVGAAGC